MPWLWEQGGDGNCPVFNLSPQRGGSAGSETLPKGEGLRGRDSSRRCWVWDPRVVPSRYSPKSTRRVLPALPVPSPLPARPAAELPAPRPLAPPQPRQMRVKARSRWQHLVAEWSLPAGLCWAVMAIPPGSPLLTQPGLGEPIPTAAGGSSRDPQGGHTARAVGVTRWQEGMEKSAAQKSRGLTLSSALVRPVP